MTYLVKMLMFQFAVMFTEESNANSAAETKTWPNPMVSSRAL